jgi:uncharacterized membrane protein YgdD (TMEM256/DUF423 family)
LKRSLKSGYFQKNTLKSAHRDVFVFERIVPTFTHFMNSAPRWIALAAGLFGFTGVALGAFGAHALKETLALHSSATTWQTAVLYHLVHSVALLAAARWAIAGSTAIVWIARLWVAGILFFSGSLYWLSLGGPKFLGPITPLGGLAFLLGWALVAWNSYHSPKE